MGLIVDTNVFISFRRGVPIDVTLWEPTDEVFISAVTVSELLIGVHLADNEGRRNRRSAFVEAIIGGMYVLDFTTDVARVHAEIYAGLTARGAMIGAHDLIIAATARYHDSSLLTDNVDEFSRVSGLHVISFAP